MKFQFDNRFVNELPGDVVTTAGIRQVHNALWSRVTPTAVRCPRVVAHSSEVLELIGCGDEDVASEQFAQLFSGNTVAPGMQPYAANYGGHQFGHWAGQLGDGRAITLGEIVNVAGERWELQLKGAGPTPYSRSADGRAVLRSSIREFLCSEAMHHLGVPTTRALCLVVTGEDVVRDMFYDGHPKPEPGAIVCRVAPSFLRFGNFELPASRGETDLLRTLVDFCIARDFPALVAQSSQDKQHVYAQWFTQICERTALMIAHWMRVGFVHGVMNTDNMSILGLTIDYGPYGWVDDYDPDWTPNTTDAQGRRYRFGWQPKVAHWNLSRLAGALSPLFADAEPLHAGLQRFADAYTVADRDNTARKLGLAECRNDDVERIEALHGLLHATEVDMTIFFRTLADLDPATPTVEPMRDAFYDEAKLHAHRPAFSQWLAAYAARLADDPLTPIERRARMHAANPYYVLRNYLTQQAIDRAEQGDAAGVMELLEVMRRPYDQQPSNERFARKRPDWARDKPGCSALSCSS